MLSRKMICAAYIPSPFDGEARFRFQAYHSLAVVKVIKRHLKLGFALRGIELRNQNGYRNDIVFLRPDGMPRTVEVKSAKQLTELHRLQAALYWSPEAGEIVLSNGSEDQLLSPDYILSVQEKAEKVRKLLTEQPDLAATQFNPTPGVCRICVNEHCPHLPREQGFTQKE
jgi:hypothetical protein